MRYLIFFLNLLNIAVSYSGTNPDEPLHHWETLTLSL
jgi:hypothetical protein